MTALSIALAPTTPQNSPSHSAMTNVVNLDHNHFFPNGPDTTATVFSGAGPSTANRQEIFEGTSAAPLTGATQLPSLLISRHITTGAAIDYGGLWVSIDSKAGGSIQANAISSFIQQAASADALGVGTQVIMQNVGGAGFGFFSNVSNAAHTCTITNASPAVVTVNGHGLLADHEITFNSVGGFLPMGMTAGTRYFVLAAGLTANSFRFSTSIGGAAVNTSSAGSGTFYVLGGALWGYNPVMINASNIPLDYNGGAGVTMSAILVQPLSSTRGGNALRVLGNAGGPLSEGLVFDANSVYGQTFYDGSSSLTSLYVAGSHTTGLDFSGATISGNHITFDANGAISLSGGTGFTFTFDSGDGMVYTRSSNTFEILIGSAVTLLIQTGLLRFDGLPAANPGAATKQFWYDPADGNRVKYAP